MSNVVQQHTDTHTKSQVIGSTLTLSFGPLGLLYSNWLAAHALSFIAIVCAVTGSLNIVTIVLLFWPISVLISLVSVGKHNANVIAP